MSMTFFTAMDVTEIAVSDVAESTTEDGQAFWARLLTLRTATGDTVSISLHAATKPDELELRPALPAEPPDAQI